MNLLPRSLLTLIGALPALAASRIEILDRGAKGDGPALDTAAIQKAVEDCAADGGGDGGAGRRTVSPRDRVHHGRRSPRGNPSARGAGQMPAAAKARAYSRERVASMIAAIP